jgi:hypothetical protein
VVSLSSGVFIMRPGNHLTMEIIMRLTTFEVNGVNLLSRVGNPPLRRGEDTYTVTWA